MSKHSEAAKIAWSHRRDRDERMEKLRTLIKMFDPVFHIEYTPGARRRWKRKGTYRVYRDLTPIRVCFSITELENIVHSLLRQTNV